MTLPENSSNLFKDIFQTQAARVILPAEGSQKAYLVAQWHQEASRRHLVIVMKNAGAARTFMEELRFFLPENKDRILFFPGYPVLPTQSPPLLREISLQRMAVLAALTRTESHPLIIITCVETVVQKLIPKDSLNHFAELIQVNEELDRDALIAKLASGGYFKTSLVEDPGDFSVRGGILDIFPPGFLWPVRIEFFGDLVESMRCFSPYTQRGFKDIFELVLIPANEAVCHRSTLPHILARLRQAGVEAGLDAPTIRAHVNQTRESGRFPGMETMLPVVYEELDTIWDYVPEKTFWILDQPNDLASAAADLVTNAALLYQKRLNEKQPCVRPDSVFLDWDQALSRIQAGNHVILDQLNLTSEPRLDQTPVYSFACRDNSVLSSALKREGIRDNPLRPLVDWFREHTDAGRTQLCIMTQESQARRLVSLLKPYGIKATACKSFPEALTLPSGIYILYGELSSGFVVEENNLALVTEHEIFGRKRIRRQRSLRSDVKTEFIAPEELKNGDFVVHAEHGIGQYQGLCSLTVNGLVQDFILILYQDNDKLYLPVDRMEMIGKYIGVDGYAPELDKIGSKAWMKSKAKARQEVEKLAADLLNLYARRRVNQGFAFSRPDNYYNEFEAAFPFEETRDQLKAIDDVQLDMESPTPMDRLVCGDVGYGKTEVAVRAAFKAVNDGKQVAVVVPTTILAEQHLSTFRERFSRHPVNIEGLSRFRNRKDQARILKGIQSGLVDIVIGTHRLLQKDVAFKSLGLLVIDEEQRFGVKHKEVLKKKRSTVDVLALTATPIPRTLHLSLTGMRDISVINTPPADRQPIISSISKYEDAVVREAVKKELDREGQVFYVHNSIQTIVKAAGHLAELVPEARIGIAHGRLSETELENVMLRFIHAEIDVLVCTTIIESGLDIPSANTMIIDKAENFGLSQIYQLRGRIGRGDHQAYAYLFVSDETRLTKDASKRLAALMEYKDLGSGFQIAMKDLQIRGAGTALGASQSGHIAAVGYDMFLKLLDQAVHDLKGEETVEPLEPEINAAMSSGFPEDYIESVEQRLTLYRRLSRINRISDIADMKKELTDRYGRLPREAENMLLKIMLRVYCIKAGVQRLDLTPDVLILNFSEKHRKTPLASLNAHLGDRFPFEFVKKDSVRIQLGRKRNNIGKALTETRDILKALA